MRVRRVVTASAIGTHERPTLRAPSGWVSGRLSTYALSARIPDHVQFGTEPVLECWVTLGMLAAVTTRLRLGALVTGTPYRNPALLAKMGCAGRIIPPIATGEANTQLRACYDGPEPQSLCCSALAFRSSSITCY